MPVSEIREEIRFGVVLYGGVSLAVYINGVTQELYRLVRSTAVDPATLTGTEKVYQDLSAALGGARFVVDVISGSSAGGINGAFLAKALATGKPLAPIRDLWIQEADIASLINDRGSVPGRRYSAQDPPESLLNSQRMYQRLLTAFDKMDAAAGAGSLTNEVDVFLTATDLEGLIVPIQLLDGQVLERIHKKVFHFRFATAVAPSNQFEKPYNPMLAFAARCTSSFPVAFEPMVLSDMDRVKEIEPQFFHGEADRNQFFPEYPDNGGIVDVPQNPITKRSFADGGDLDNKPFSFAIDTMMNRADNGPVKRRLLYVEPAPDDPAARAPLARRPDAVRNAWLAISELPRYETIREDLQRVLRRNQDVRRLNELKRVVHEAVRQAKQTFRLTDQNLAAGEWEKMDTLDLAQRFGLAYLGYHRLKISDITDRLADQIAQHFKIPPDSAYAREVRLMVRAWRDRRYGPKDGKRDQYNAFLSAFDIEFRIRRLRHVIGEIDEPQASLSPETMAKLAGVRKGLADVLLFVRGMLEQERTDFAGLGQLDDLKKALDQARAAPADAEKIGVRNWCPQRSAEREYSDAQRVLDAYYDKIDGVAEKVAERCRAGFTVLREKVTALLDIQDADLQRLLQEYKRFEDCDAVTYPLIHNTDVRELEEIGVFRVSPLDATGPVKADGKPVVDEKEAVRGGRGALENGNPRKLKGASVGNFGGFLDAEWRRNDMLWGRLDGAERLISVLLPKHPGKDELIRRAQEAIIDEELRDSPLIAGLPGPLTAPDVLAKYRERLLAQPDRERTSNQIARSTTVLSKVLDDIAKRQKVADGVFPVMAKLGQAGMGLIALASQRGLASTFTSHWIELVYLAGVVLVALGIFVSGATALGSKVLLGAFAVHMAVGLLRDYFSHGNLFWRWLQALAFGAVACLAVIGLLFMESASWRVPPDSLRWLLIAAYALMAAGVGGTLVAQASGPNIEGAMLRLEHAGGPEPVAATVGDAGDARRGVIRRMLGWDNWLLTGYGAAFAITGLWIARVDGGWQGWPILACGLLAALADLTENVRISNLMSWSNDELRRGTVTTYPLGAARAKWLLLAFAIALIGCWFWPHTRTGSYAAAATAAALAVGGVTASRVLLNAGMLGFAIILATVAMYLFRFSML